MPRSLLLLTALAGLAACRMDLPDGILPGDTCGAGGLQGLIGQPATVLDEMRFSQPVRIVRPGQMVTMDFSAQRLTIETDAANLIARLSCG